LANAVENGCEWCVAFHSFVALKLGIDEETVSRLRSGGEPGDARLRALTGLARRLIRNRGRLDAADLDAFVRAGFHKDQALEVVAGLAMSIMANYAGNFVRPELDTPIRAQHWSRAN
jgi:AhpD family alkylhydroperoxidase